MQGPKDYSEAQVDAPAHSSFTKHEELLLCLGGKEGDGGTCIFIVIMRTTVCVAYGMHG